MKDDLAKPSYWGCRISRFLTVSAVGAEKDLEVHNADFSRRQSEFITSLINSSDKRFTFDIRYISYPDSAIPARGRIEALVLGRIDSPSKDERRLFGGEFLRGISSTFPEFEFSLLDQTELNKALKPFSIGHVLQISRRHGREVLDTLRPPTSPRNAKRAEPESDASRILSLGKDGALTHFFPFLPTSGSFNNLFRLMLLEPDPTMLTVRLRPATLTAEEALFLEQSIGICERYSQISQGITAGKDIPYMYPALRAKAAAHLGHFSRFLFGLRDNAALMTIQVASTATVSPFISEVFAGLITHPAGGTAEMRTREIANFLAGGYQITEAKDNALDVAAIEALDIVPRSSDLLPPLGNRLLSLFESYEAAAAFRLPPISKEDLPGVDIRGWKTTVPPRTLPSTGVLVGVSAESHNCRDIRIAPAERLRHVYAVGQTGTGKSTMLRTMILDDINSGQGVCVMDPHGDLYKDLVGLIPKNRLDDVVLIDPTDTEFPVSINLLEYESESARHFIIQEFTSIIISMLRDSYGANASTMLGPIFLQHLRMNLLLATSDPDSPGTLQDFYSIFQEKEYWRRWLPLKVADPFLQKWVENVLPQTDYRRQTSDGPSFGGYFGSKIEAFLFDPLLRNIFNHPRSTIRFRDAMDSGKIVLVNLAKGELSEANSRLLGMIILAKLQSAALGRSKIPERERRPFYVYVDEFQSIATGGFISMLSEARKFGLGMVLANQFIEQLDNEKIMFSVFGNVGTLVSFRLGNRDSERMEKEFAPDIMRQDLLGLPNWHAYISTLIENQTTKPFEMCTIPASDAPGSVRATEVQRRSREKYGRALLSAEVALSDTSPGAAEARLNTEGWLSATELHTLQKVVDKARTATAT